MRRGSKPRFSTQKPLRSIEHEFAPGEPEFYNKQPEFSFKYYQHNHRKYSAKCINECKDFHTMFERLKSMSQLTWKGIIRANHVYHFHPIEWGKTDEPNGFKLASSDLNEVAACQFKIFKECRIMGFFNQNNIFELVWIDRHHEVYSHH